MTKICPHCGKSFVCKENDILNCDCAKVIVSAETRNEIARRYSGCLCTNCLKNFGKIPVDE